MKYKPHEYQKYAIEKLMQNPRYLLSLDMGLGKTSITLAAIKQMIHEFMIDRVLIIAPKHVAEDVWTRETAKWEEFSDLQVRIAIGSASTRRRALMDHTADIVTINRENVVWMTKEVPEWREMFDMIVIDESSSFKSYSSNRFKALRKAIPSETRVVELSGTPMPRSIEDLWSQIYLLDRGERLGSSMSAFRREYEVPGRRFGLQVWEWKPREGSEDRIYTQISDISMSMKAKDWISVPESTTIDHFVKLPPKQRAEYRKLEAEQIISMEEHDIVGSNAGVLAGKLLQYSNGTVYDTEKHPILVHDLKLEALDEIMDSTEDPVLVFYWFKPDLARLMQRYKALQPRELRTAEDITDWNSGKVRMMIGHPASMGHGLNLQDGGHIIVWYGLTWSLEIYQQANARLNRQGQTQHVQIHRILMTDTVDEDVIKSIDEKDWNQQHMIEAIKARIIGRQLKNSEKVR